MANLSDEELTIVALILDKETEYTKKKKKKWVHQTWPSTFIHIF